MMAEAKKQETVLKKDIAFKNIAMKHDIAIRGKFYV